MLVALWYAAGGAAAQGPPPPEQPRLVVQLGQTSWITSAVFSPDGRLVLTGGEDGAAVLWDGATGAELRRFEGHGGEVRDVAFSPDGRYALTGDADGTARLWNVATGDEAGRFEGHEGEVHDAAFSPDGRYVLTGGEDHTARLWDAGSGAELRRREAASPILAVAFSPDGRRAVWGGWDGAGLWDVETGAELRRFTGPSTSAWFTSLAFSPDGRHLLTGSWDGRARLWAVESAAELRHFEGDLDAVAPQITAVAFSPDGRHVLTGSHDETVWLWDAETGAERLRLPAQGLVEAVAFSPDGGRLLTGADDAARLWDAGTGEPLQHFAGAVRWVFALAASPDGRHLLSGDASGVVRLWDLETGAEALRLETHADQVSAVVFSPDGRYLLTGSYDTYARLWDAGTGALLHTFEGPFSDDPGDPAGVNAVAFSPDGRLVLTGNQDETVRLWDAETGAELRRFEGHAQWVTAVSFSPDGRLALSGSLDRTARVWDTATGAELRRFDGRGVGYDLFLYATFAPDGRHVLTFGGVPDSTLLWDLETGRRLRYFEGHTERVNAAAFSPDGRRLLTGSDDGTIRLYDVETGEERRRFDVPATWVTAVAFLPDGQYVLAAGDTQTHLFDAATGERVASLVSFTDGTWAVVAPDGRFDTNDLEAVEGLHWVAPDDPLTPLPIEAFMADRYEPRLLPRLLAGEAFPDARGLLERNRVQPAVAVTDVALAADGTASVTVTVEGLERAYGGATHASGAHDLRLFRDGQLVAWQDGVLVEGAGSAALTFDGLALPSGADTLTFSAYAFNADRVKSRTAYAGLAVPAGAVPARERRAYVVSLGVDAFADPAWDLRFAANDARQFQAALPPRLAASGRFDAVVAVPLLAAHDGQGAGAADARKATLRAVLDLLAGRPVPDDLRARIPQAERLAKATPDDLVLITASSHGYVDAAGVFYVLPEDVPPRGGRAITPALLAAAISSDELSRWLRGVDAGTLALVVDACHAAAAVEGSGFKPGPMGSRGLGQLAFDKGMRVLTATQSDDVALESDALAQGLLSFALVRNGLEAGRADADPADGRIELGEWLRYGVDRVPALYEEVRRGAVETFGEGRSEVLGAPPEADGTQRPSLFDFTRGRGAAVIVGGAAER